MTITYLPSILKNTSICPNTIFEIGASNGIDAEYLRAEFNIDTANIYCFEPNPENFHELITRYPKFNSFNVAVSDFNGPATFYMHLPARDVSSFRKVLSNTGYWHCGDNNYKEHTIDVVRMDSFINKNDIQEIDICKIDVEGSSFEVLSGFGDKLQIVKCLHVEAEINPVFANDQKLFVDIEHLLKKNNFTMTDYREFNPFQNSIVMCDSVWIQNKFI